MLGNTLRIRNRDRWNRQKVRIGKDDPLRREKFLFCMQNGLRVRGFPDVEETPEGVLLPQISEITEPEPTAFDDGHYVLYERGWEEQRKILIESGVEQEKIHVDLWNLENRHLNYVISSRIPSSVLRISWEVLEYRYRKGKQLVMELNRNREERYILPCWWGKGDTILLGSLLRQLRNGEEKRKIVLLIRRGHEELTTLFPWIDGYRILNQDERISMTTYFDIFGEAECGNVTYVMRSFPWCGLGKNWSDLEESTTMASVFRKGLSLEENSPISMFPEEKMVPRGPEELRLYRKIKTEKNVLFVPRANGLYMVLEQSGFPTGREQMEGFMQRLAGVYASEGYKVYCNVGPGEENIIPGARPLTLSIGGLIRICRGFSDICAVRTGLCDAVALTGMRINIIYPEGKGMGMEMFRKGTDLSEINRNVKNILWSPGRESDIIEELLRGQKDGS